MNPASSGPDLSESNEDGGLSGSCQFISSNSTCALCSRQTRIDRRVLEAREALNCLLEEQRALRETMNGAHDPMHRLPVEVATSILDLCLPSFPPLNDPTMQDQMSWTYLNYPGGHISPLNLGAICRGWREIVWTNPCFWTCIDLRLSERTPLEVATLVREWLDRSAQLPLMIKLNYDSRNRFSELDETGFFKPLIEAISSVANRWSFIHLQLPASYFSLLRCTLPQPHSWPHFKSLSMWSLGADKNGTFDLGAEYPGPEHLQVHDLLFENVCLRYDNLKYFHQGSWDIKSCIEILRQAPRLSSATLTNVSSESADWLPVTNPSIEHLRLMDDNPALWQSLTLPSLRELEVMGHCQQIGRAVEFIQRSQCRLRKVYFNWPTNDWRDALLIFLREVPSLEDLGWTYADAELEESVLNLVGETADVEQSTASRQFLPNLSKLTIKTAPLFPWPALASAASTSPPRLNYVRRPLRDITIHLDFRLRAGDDDPRAVEYNTVAEEIDSDSLQNLIRLINNGMDIKLCDCDGGDMLAAWIRYYEDAGGEYEWVKSYRKDREECGTGIPQT